MTAVVSIAGVSQGPFASLAIQMRMAAVLLTWQRGVPHQSTETKEPTNERKKERKRKKFQPFWMQQQPQKKINGKMIKCGGKFESNQNQLRMSNNDDRSNSNNNNNNNNSRKSRENPLMTVVSVDSLSGIKCIARPQEIIMMENNHRPDKKNKNAASAQLQLKHSRNNNNKSMQLKVDDLRGAQLRHFWQSKWQFFVVAVQSRLKHGNFLFPFSLSLSLSLSLAWYLSFWIISGGGRGGGGADSWRIIAEKKRKTITELR